MMPKRRPLVPFAGSEAAAIARRAAAAAAARRKTTPPARIQPPWATVAGAADLLLANMSPRRAMLFCAMLTQRLRERAASDATAAAQLSGETLAAEIVAQEYPDD